MLEERVISILFSQCLPQEEFSFFFHLVETKEKKWIWVGGHFFFGAVLTKGIAIFLFLPAICLFAIHKKEIQKAFLICLFPILGFLLWAVAITIWGLERSSENYGSGNMLETMWLFDTWGRLTGANDFPDSPTSRWEFFLVYLDLEFRFVGYLLPLGLVFYLVQFIRSRKSKPTQSITFQDKDLLNFSLLVWIIPVVVLTLAKNKFSWYLAPVSPMLFIFIITLAKNYFHKNLLISILILFTVFGLGKKWNRYSKPPAISSKWLEIEKDIRENNRTCIFRGTKPDLVLWLKFQHPNLIACEIQD